LFLNVLKRVATYQKRVILTIEIVA